MARGVKVVTSHSEADKSKIQGGAMGFEDRCGASNTDAGVELYVYRSSSVGPGYGFVFGGAHARVYGIDYAPPPHPQ